MAIAVVDDRQTQRVCDLRTGEAVADESPSTQIVREVLRHHPYPGDTSLSNRWVGDTALDLMDRYRPHLVCLLYAYQYFAMRAVEQDESDRRRMLMNAFREVARFANSSRRTPVVVGTGEMVPVAGEIDVSRLGERAVATHHAARYLGLHEPSGEDLAYLGAHPQVERVVSRGEWEALFPGAEHTPARLPDYLAVARRGWTFRAAGPPQRPVLMIPGENRVIPVLTKLGEVRSITDVRPLIESHIERSKIALVVLEGFGLRDFALAYQECENGAGWFSYEPGEAQLLTLTTGTHQVLAHPPGARDAAGGETGSEYPFSGHFTRIPARTLGQDLGCRSIAVGNHSMLTHLVFGTDIVIECTARGSTNSGSLGVIYR
jgi:hypothetical protein